MEGMRSLDGRRPRILLGIALLCGALACASHARESDRRLRKLDRRIEALGAERDRLQAMVEDLEPPRRAICGMGL